MEEAYEYLFEEGYVEPKIEDKQALIAKLQSGDFTLSFSSISAFSISPQAFIAYKLKEWKRTPAMLLGELVHCILLEEEKVKHRYHIAPDVDATTVDGKREWANLYQDFTKIELPTNKVGNPIIPKIADIIADVEKQCGVTIIPHKTNEEAKFRARRLLKNKASWSVIKKVQYTERDIKFEFEGLNFTGKIDAGGDGFIADIKNMPDATLQKAQRVIFDRRLNWQAFGYDRSQGGGNRAYILGVDGKGEVSTHCFGQRAFDSAEREMKEICRKFKNAVFESNFDPSIFDSSQDFWLKDEHNRHGINYL